MRVQNPLLSLAIGLFLVSCATTAHFPTNSNAVPPEPLLLQAGPEVYGLRVDLLRVDESSDKNYAVLKANSANYEGPSLHSYAPLGIDLGNGLFYDANGNLSVDLSRLYHWQPPFDVTERVEGFVPVAIHFKADQSSVTRTGGGKDLPDMKATHEDEGIALSGAPQVLAGTLLQSDNEYSFAKSGFALSDRLVMRQASERRIEEPRLLGTTLSLQKSDDFVSLRGGAITVTRHNNEIVLVTKSGLLGSRSTIRYRRTSEGCEVIDTQGRLIEIRADGPTVKVTMNGKLSQTYEYHASTDGS